VYYLFRLREEYRACGGDLALATERTLATSGKAILFVSSAIALGYLTLCLSKFRVYDQLGSLVALAMVTSSFATLSVLASLVTLTARTRWATAVLGTVPEPDHAPSRQRAALRG
jgi:predicted RND superfamily exporter protein